MVRELKVARSLGVGDPWFKDNKTIIAVYTQPPLLTFLLINQMWVKWQIGHGLKCAVSSGISWNKKKNFFWDWILLFSHFGFKLELGDSLTLLFNNHWQWSKKTYYWNKYVNSLYVFKMFLRTKIEQQPSTWGSFLNIIYFSFTWTINNILFL